MSRQMIILTILLSSVTAQGQDTLDLTIMSFNIRHGAADDGEDSWPLRKDIVVDAIRAYQPDFVGTQECLDFQAEYLAEHLPEYNWMGIGRDPGGTGEYMAVFYKKEFIPLETGNFWLSETPDVPSRSWDSACNRMVTWGKFKHTSSGKEFHFYNTHFDHQSPAARQGAAKVLVDRLAALAEPAALIITGDFNADGGHSEPWHILSKAGFKDAWINAAERVGPPVTFGAFKVPRQAQNKRIDWILYRGPADVKKCETVLFNREEQYPSDHYPVVASIALTLD